MHKVETKLSEIKLVGITTRTNNAAEMNPQEAQIGSVMQRYFGERVHDNIQNRKNPGITFCVYTNYESDFTDDYTYFIGEEVTSFEDLSGDLEALTIPVQNYIKFTNTSGPMPSVCINMWKNIWQEESSFTNPRSYIADFEVYDERSHNPQNTVLDIYVGVKDKYSTT